VLLAACVGLTLGAGPATRYALDTARALHAPGQQTDPAPGDRHAPSPLEGTTP
jgi:hypothetical protein